VLAASIPFLFVHERYQPDLGVGLDDDRRHPPL
jgi:hypothetical protein